MLKKSWVILLSLVLYSLCLYADNKKDEGHEEGNDQMNLPQAKLELNLLKKKHYAPMPVELDASKSFAKKGNNLVSYEFDFNDGSPKKVVNLPKVNHIFEIRGPSTIDKLKIWKKKEDEKKFTVTLRVQDNVGVWSKPSKKVLELKQIPDPGSKGNKTLEGIDLDEDGIRDDVQLYISSLLADATPQERAAFRQWARDYMASYLVTNDKQLTIARNFQVFKSYDCIRVIYKSLNKGTSDYFPISDKVLAEILNTDERVKADHKSYSLFSGQVSTLIRDFSACEFDPNSF